MTESQRAILVAAQELFRSKKFNDAISKLEEHRKLLIQEHSFHNLLGLCWTELLEHNRAVECFVESIKLEPLRPLPYVNIGNCLAANLKFDEAEKYFQLALTVEGDFLEAIVGLGVVAFQRSDYEKCEEHFRAALNKAPENVALLTNLGNCYSVQGKRPEAMACLEAAKKLDPENSMARTNLGLLKLGERAFSEGWIDYEYRFDSGNFMPKRFSSIPRWPGPLATTPGRTKVLIWSEQGLGDEIMFSTIFKDLPGSKYDFTIECDPRLYEIFSNSFPNLTFMPKGLIPETPLFDYQIPIGSLGLLYRKSENSFERPVGGHLRLKDTNLPIESRNFLDSLKRPLIGVSWASYALTQNFRDRKSIAPDQFSKLTTRLPGTCISLQFTNPHRHENQSSYEIPNGVELVPGVNMKRDITFVAQILSECDYVVTIGNTVAHIAGATGVKAKVLLPNVADWRWGHKGARSVWYDSLSLIRNAESNARWDDLLAQLSSDIRAG